MKKRIDLIVLALFALLIAACASPPDATVEEGESAAVVEESEGEPAV